MSPFIGVARRVIRKLISQMLIMGKWIFFKMFTGADLISAAVTITPTSPFIAHLFLSQAAQQAWKLCGLEG